MAVQEVVEERAGYKKTKLGWIPEGWKVDTFYNLTKINQGLQIAIKDRLLSKEVGSLFYITNEFLNPKSKKKFYVKNPPVNVICNENDILMTRTGNTGQVVTNVKGVFHNNFFKIKVNEDRLFKKFLFQFLIYNRTQDLILRLAGNSTIPDLNHGDFYRIRLALPPIQEQKAIANCLSTWDRAIEKQTQLIKAKQTQKKALMQQLLTGKKRLPGYTEEWEVYKFNKIAERITRKNNELDDTVVTISAQRGFILQEDFFNKRVASKTLSNYTLVHKGEFCYNKSYSKGYPMGAFKRLDDFEKAVVTTLYICFKLKDIVSSDFMNHYFNGGRMIKGLMRIAQEGGRAHGLLNISLPDFFNLKVTIPEKKEQTAIAKVLNTADKEIALLQQQLQQLQQQKKGLMQQLLTGKKRLKY